MFGKNGVPHELDVSPKELVFDPTVGIPFAFDRLSFNYSLIRIGGHGIALSTW